MSMPTRISRLAECLPYLLAVTAEHVDDVFGDEYRARYDLKLPEWRVLVVLGDAGTLTQRDLVRATLLDKVAVNRACKVLEERGLIGRSPNDRDGRSHHIELSARGREIHAEMIPIGNALEREIFSDLNEVERRQFVQLLARVRNTVKWLDRPQAA